MWADGESPLGALDGAKYYDAPDGERPVEKVMTTVKKGFVCSMLLGIHDVCWKTSPKNIFETINCMAFWTVPIVSMSATVAAVTFMSTRIRGKDDRWNSIIGGASSAPILHVWTKSTPLTCFGTVAIMALGFAAKVLNQNDWKVFYKPRQLHGIHEFDMSLARTEDKDFRSPYFVRW